MGRNTGRGKVAYSWISPDPAKAGLTLGVVVVVVVTLLVLSVSVEALFVLPINLDRY